MLIFRKYPYFSDFFSSNWIRIMNPGAVGGYKKCEKFFFMKEEINVALNLIYVTKMNVLDKK